MTRIGPKMRLAADYVTRNPGCVMRDCAHYVSPHPQPSRNEALGYSIVWRAVFAGMINFTKRGGRYYLTSPKQES